jgi:PAS domain S-box-containing protein
LTEEAFDRVCAINLRGTIMACKQVIPIISAAEYRNSLRTWMLFPLLVRRGSGLFGADFDAISLGKPLPLRRISSALRRTMVRGHETESPHVEELEQLRQRVRELEVAAANIEQYRYSEELYRRVLAASQDCVKLLDLDGSLLVMSENGQRVTEIDNIVPLIGKPWAEFWPEESASVIRDAVSGAAAGRVVRFTGFCPTAKGTPKWWDVTVSPVINPAGRPERILAMSRDITERVAAQRAMEALNAALDQELSKRSVELLQSGDRLGAVREQFEIADLARWTAEIALDASQSQLDIEVAAKRVAQETLRQSQKMEVLGQLTGGIAHDFNNVLMGMSGSLELVRSRTRNDPSLSRTVDIAFRAIERGEALVRRLMAFSRPNEANLTAFDLSEAVKDLAGMLSAAGGPGQTITLETAPTCRVVADANQFDNALLNLCLNARDAMPEGGSLIIRTEEVDVGAEELRDPGHEPGEYAVLPWRIPATACRLRRWRVCSSRFSRQSLKAGAPAWVSRRFTGLSVARVALFAWKAQWAWERLSGSIFRVEQFCKS